MALVFESQQAKPGTHALIVGVSDYANLPPFGQAGPREAFGFKRLSSPAISAYSVYKWLVANQLDLAQPLASVRLLLCASPAEKAAEPALNGAFERPTFQNFRTDVTDWWKAACSDEHNVTIFYFAGHGLRDGVSVSKDGVVLLLDDFGQPVGNALENAVALDNIVIGMAPSADGPDVARTQFYFVDACRDEKAEIGRLQGAQPHPVFSRLTERDERDRPVFYATVNGAEALGRSGQRSYFCEALLDALDYACDGWRDFPDGTKIWPVTTKSLHYALGAKFMSFGIQNPPQRAGVSNGNSMIRKLGGAPQIEVDISLRPDDCVGKTTVEVFDETGKKLVGFNPPPCAHPYSTKIPMGVYRITATASAPYPPRTDKMAPFDLRHRNFPLRIA